MDRERPVVAKASWSTGRVPQPTTSPLALMPLPRIETLAGSLGNKGAEVLKSIGVAANAVAAATQEKDTLFKRHHRNDPLDFSFLLGIRKHPVQTPLSPRPVPRLSDVPLSDEPGRFLCFVSVTLTALGRRRIPPA